MHIFRWWKELIPYLEHGSSMLHNQAIERQYLIRILMWVSTIVLLVFSVVHYFYDEYWLTGLQLFLALIYITMLLLPERLLSLTNQENIVLTMTTIVFLSLVATGGTATTGVYWSPFFPFIVFSIAGLARGKYWILMFLVGLVMIQGMDILGLFKSPYSFEERFYFSIAFMVYVFIAALLEAVRIRQHIELENSNERLKCTRQELNVALSSLEKKVEARTFELKMANRHLLQEIAEHKKTNVHLKETEQKFYQAQKMEALGTLVGGISHDFNNMLSGINANLFLVQRQTKAIPEVQLKIDDIELLVFHAADMIKQLLTFARKDKAEMKDFDMRPLISESIKLTEVSLPPQVLLRPHLDATQLPIHGSATQLQQVVMNLINNASDALHGCQKPEIYIRLAPLRDAQEDRHTHPDLEGEWIYMSVQDNGMGIEEDKVEHIFEPFFSTKIEGEGTGLGLAMCYGAVTSHQGFIEVESKLGEGTSFHIYLPMSRVERIQRVKPVSNSLLGKAELILLVDDDISLRSAYAGVLASLGYQTIEASDGQQAVEVYAKRRDSIDLVMMDVVMPNMNGIEAASHMLNLDKQTKILFVTGYEQENLSAVAKLSGEEQVRIDAIPRLKKPFSIELLSKMLGEALISSDAAHS